MEKKKSIISNELDRVLHELSEKEETDVLVYPNYMPPQEEFLAFLKSKQKEVNLSYNVLNIANCIVVKAQKKVIIEIASRDDVSKITLNPRFTIT